jgi:Glycosyltransferase like family 2
VPERVDVSYVLPLRWLDTGPLPELGRYLHALRPHVAELIVVDGSPAAVYRAVEEALPPGAEHLPPDPRHSGAMGKVPGVLTGLDLAGRERVVIADDDVRWTAPTLRRAHDLLADAEVVRPQNFFDPLVWHARWDTARTLLNRVWSGERDLGPGDFPGTLAVRAGFLRAIGGYDGDCLFENLELMRTVKAAGGRVSTPLDLYVARRPPSSAHFLSQRVRQAYDDFAIPARMATMLGLGPAVAVVARCSGPRAVAGFSLAAIAVAEAGRRRGGGVAVLPVSGSLLAPAWLAERAVTSWAAVAAKLFRGGVAYGDSRLSRSAHSVAELEATVFGSPSTVPAA